MQMYAAPTHIPDDIARLAREQHLGDPQADYTILKLARDWRWHGPIILILVCLDLMILTILTIELLTNNFEILPDGFLYPIIGLCNPMVAIYQTFSSFAYKSYRLYPCDAGIILKQSTKKFRTIHWDEIGSVWCTFARTPKSLFAMHRVYKIRCHDGYTLTFSGNRKSLVELDKTIEEQFTRRRLTSYLVDYEAGRPLNFGPLSIDLNGVNARGNVLPWEQITEISLLQDRRLVIYNLGNQQRPWLNMQAFNVANLTILLALVERVRKGQPVREERVQPFAPNEEQRATTAFARAICRMNQLPEDIAALATEHRLGERRTDEGLGLSRIVTWLTIAIQFTGFLIGAGIMTIIFNITASTTFDPLQVFFDVLRIIFPLLSIAMGMIFFILEFPHIYRYTYTFEHGLILRYGRKAPVICLWDEIETVWRASFIGKRPAYLPGILSAYTIQLHDGSRYTLSKLDIKQEALGNILRERVAPLQLPAILSAYQDEQTLSFGPLHVNQQGIAMDTRLLPWLQVKSVRLEESRLAIYNISQRSPWGELPAARVPNLFVLFALADYVRESAISTGE